MANKKVRILVACMIGGIAYRPDDVVNLPESLVKAHGDQVDANKDAVAYALSINGNQVQEYADPAAERRSELSAQIVELESRLAAAELIDKPAIQSDLDAAKVALAELG